jgi:hypothetical protein
MPGILRRVEWLIIVTLDKQRNIRKITLNSADPFAKYTQAGLASILALEHVAVCLGEI